jgi:hypothetical protein
MFLNPRARRLIVNWDIEARRMLARFRLAVCARLGDPEIGRLLARLTHASPQFATWWSEFDDVMAERPQRKELAHPIAGPLVFEYLTYQICDNESFRFVVHTPLDEAGTKTKLKALIQSADANQQAPAIRMAEGDGARGRLCR